MSARAVAGTVDRALCAALALDWDQQNRGRFRSAMVAPSFGLIGAAAGEAAGRRLGLWSRAGRLLQIDRAFAMTAPWPAVREVLLHEMAHQFVDEVYEVRDQTPHGDAFQQVCARLGIDSRASGAPASPDPQPEDRMVARVRKLLALAASGNQHEAEAAMNAAQALMLKYNLDVSGAAERVGWRVLGEPARRHGEDAKVLGGILSRHFFVKCIWVQAYMPRAQAWGTVLEVSGTPENLELAAYVHAFLQATTQRLWEKDGVGHTRTALARFRAGAYHAFHQKLNEQAQRQAETGLVWVGDPRVDAWFGQRHPHVRTLRSAGYARDSDFEQGRVAGRGIVLHRPISGTEARGLALPDKRGR